MKAELKTDGTIWIYPENDVEKYALIKRVEFGDRFKFTIATITKEEMGNLEQ